MNLRADHLRSRCVVLRHELCDGTWHYDWMLERASAAQPPGSERGTLITFRTNVLVTTTNAFAAQRLGDHRAIYLDYQGPVSGNRGTVRRVARGWCTIEVDTLQRFIVDCAFTDDLGDARRFVGTCELLGAMAGLGEESTWNFICERLL